MHDEPTPFHPLNAQVAVVTGASRGMGAAIARRLATMGAAIVATARGAEQLSRTAQSIRENGGRCEAVPCDVTNLAQVEAVGRAVEKKFGRVDAWSCVDAHHSARRRARSRRRLRLQRRFRHDHRRYIRKRPHRNDHERVVEYIGQV